MSKELELQLLYDALVDNSTLDNPLKQDHFTDSDVAKIYSAMITLHKERKEVDTVSVIEQLFNEDLGHLAIVVYELCGNAV